MERRVKSVLKRARGDIAVDRSRRELVAEMRRGVMQLERGLAALGEELAARDTKGPFEQARSSTRAMFEHPRPWMVEEAVEFASELLTPGTCALEWGGGASTPYWCERVGVLHTVEASPGWALILLDYMTRRTDLIDRWRFHFVGANWPSTEAAKRRTGRAMPQHDVRRSLEDDYAILLPDRIDAVILDGAVRQRTAERLGAYVDRDRPALIVVDNMEAAYVATSTEAVDLTSYDRHDFWASQRHAKTGEEVPHCTSVWVRSDGRTDRVPVQNT